MLGFAEPGSSLVAPVGNLPPDSVIFGRSPTMHAARQRVEKIAASHLPVLIHGESGTGKEVFAKLIHRRSPWHEGPFVKVSCPAIPNALLESELFGYEKGAFTGAYGSKPGRVEMAHRGTLFMDEIAELDMGLQAKLLQLLQDGQFCRIGSQEDSRVEVRVVCSTNRNLIKETELGSFREDLYYRINVVNLCLPPLRERRADIPELVDYLLATYNHRFRCSARPLPSRMLSLFGKYHWPGNIRQLENLIKRYVVLGSEEAVSSELRDQDSINFDPETPGEGLIPLKAATKQAIQELERTMILRALDTCKWNRKLAARALKISYRTFLYKTRRAGLPTRGSFGPSGPA